jgi:murein DD-endopeptidase MepM/ murein hydrolase activator NlpD
MKPRKSVYLTLISMLLASISISACQPVRPLPGIPTTITLEQALPTLTPTPLIAGPTISGTQEAQTQTEATPLAAGSTPVRFTFPLPGPAPVSLWRPPLYDTPWALGPFDHFYFKRPIAADEVNWPLADYRYGAILPKSTFIHTGVDIDAPLHTPIISAGSGTVLSAGFGLYSGNNDPDDPYGLAVTIRHDFGYQGHQIYTIYAHMDRIDVKVGQRVETGTQLGIVGLTGNTTGPHVHFEVRLEGNSFFATRNPELWLAPPQGWGVLVGKLFNTNQSVLTGQVVQVTSKASGHKWTVISYENTTINSDEYYNENLVLSDLPAGDYEININYLDHTYLSDITIRAGAVSYFTFRGKYGYKYQLPAVGNPSERNIFMGLISDKP